MPKTENNLETVPSTRDEAATKQTKLRLVSDELENLAVGLGAGAKLPTVGSLCSRFGVSVTTLTTVLGQLETSGVIRRHQGKGLFVADGLRKRNIVLLCDADFFARPGLSPFWLLLLDHVRERARTEALGFELHFTETHLQSSDSGRPAISPTVAGLMEGGRIDGVLAIGVSFETSAYLEKRGIPVVAFGGPATHSVSIDMADLVSQGVQALAAVGARQIGLWTSFQPGRKGWNAPPTPQETARKEAFQEALETANLPFDESLVEDSRRFKPSVDNPLADKLPQEQGYETALDVFMAGKESVTDSTLRLPDGIVSPNDMFTVGVLSALRRLGLRPGIDLHIATHANIGSTALLGYEEELILLEVDPSHVVAALFAKLEALMERECSVPLATSIQATLRKNPERTA
jgi:DNA-binding LacI/PurR family transcriptional regulator